MEVGQEWAYRARTTAASERVRVLVIDKRKHTTRVVVEFVDGARAGAVENIPAGRLRCVWSEVEEYDALMANWQRLDDYDLTSTEEYAAMVVAELLLLSDVATIDEGGVRNCAGIHDVAAFEKLIGKDLTYFTDAVAAFQDDGTWWLSAEGALLIVEAACRVHPMAVLEWVTTEERDAREKSKRGAPRTSLDGEGYQSTPDSEYAFYLEFHRPVHELLRQWCGHRAVSFQERLSAAEAELHRLNELVARAADGMRDNKLDHLADWLDEEHDKDRITPYNIRPIVDRPLHASEIPVRTVYRKGWWHRG